MRIVGALVFLLFVSNVTMGNMVHRHHPDGHLFKRDENLTPVLDAMNELGAHHKASNDELGNKLSTLTEEFEKYKEKPTQVTNIRKGYSTTAVGSLVIFNTAMLALWLGLFTHEKLKNAVMNERLRFSDERLQQALRRPMTGMIPEYGNLGQIANPVKQQ